MIKPIPHKNIAFVLCKHCIEVFWYDKTQLIPFVNGKGIVCPECGKEIIIDNNKENSGASSVCDKF